MDKQGAEGDVVESGMDDTVAAVVVASDEIGLVC